MRRREFITLLGGAAVVCPLAARAQQPVTRWRRSAVLLGIAQDDPDAQRDLQNFRKGLWELGWTVGSNILIEYRYANADPAQIQTHAAELVGLPAEVVLAGGSFPVAALRRETRTTPIVFVRVADPVSQGFVASLAHPGANVTGFSSLEYDLSGKWLELLKGIAPQLVRVSLMFNPPTAPYGLGFLRSFETAAPSFAVKPIGALIHDPAEIEGTMSALGSGADGGLIVLPDAFTNSRADHRACRAPSCAHYLRLSLLYRCRRPDLIRSQQRRHVPACRSLCRSHPQRREARRSAGPADDHVRTSHQSQDRQGTRSQCAGKSARTRRRGDRIVILS